jgi:hypothetical protein
MKRKSKIWFLAGISLVCLIGVTALMERQLRVTYRTPLTCCVEDNGTGGGRGLVLWAEKLGWPVRPLREPLWEAVELLPQRTGNCVLTAGNEPWSPWGENLTEEQWRSLSGWIKRGNALVIATAAPQQLPPPLTADIFGDTQEAWSRPAGSLGLENLLTTPSVEAAPATVPIRVGNRGVLDVVADGPRCQRRLLAAETAGDGKGTVWLRLPWGQGAIYLLLDDHAWTNAGFDQGENARVLAATLAQEVHGGVFGIDEYRHGHGRVESFISLLWALPGAQGFLGIGLVLALLYFYGRNVRFGPAELYHLPERRTAREYIEAVAQLNERARAAPLALTAIVDRMQNLAARRGQQPAEAEQAVAAAAQYVGRGERPAQPAQAIALAAQLIRLRKKWHGVSEKGSGHGTGTTARTGG